MTVTPFYVIFCEDHGIAEPWFWQVGVVENEGTMDEEDKEFGSGIVDTEEEALEATEKALAYMQERWNIYTGNISVLS